MSATDTLPLPASPASITPGLYPVNGKPIVDDPRETGSPVAVENGRPGITPGEGGGGVPVQRAALKPASPLPFNIWSPDQFLAYTPDPSSNLIGDCLLQKGEWTSFIGIGGLGKTRLTLWMCICQILGRPWCGLATAGDPQICLLLSTESGLRRWKKDLEKMFLGLTEEERAKINRYLRLLAVTKDEEGDLNLGDESNRARLQITLKTINPGIVVFDPFSDMIDGDENSAADLIASHRTLRSILRAAAPSAAVVIIHHARTGSKNVAQAGDNFNAGNFGRGSKALYCRVRCELQLAPGDKGDSDRLVLACGKNNDGQKFQTRGIIFDPETFSYSVDPAFDLEAWRADVAGKRGDKTASVADVVRVVRDLGKHPGDEIKAGLICIHTKDATGASTRTIKERLKTAVEHGYLRKGDVYGTYSLGAKPLKT